MQRFANVLAMAHGLLIIVLIVGTAVSFVSFAYRLFHAALLGVTIVTQLLHKGCVLWTLEKRLRGVTLTVGYTEHYLSRAFGPNLPGWLIRPKAPVLGAISVIPWLL